MNNPHEDKSAMLAPLKSTLQNFCRRFRMDQRGNVAIMTGLLSLPAFAIGGAAIDFSRAIATKAELSTALDSALLSLARSPAGPDDVAKAYVKNYVGDVLVSNGKVLDWKIADFHQTVSTVDATLSATIETAVLGIVKMTEMTVTVTSEVTRENKKVEVALVLDNTGSMGSGGKIQALREATHDLLDILFAGKNSEEMVKVGMVPFVTSVNIKADGFKTAWIDKNGEAQSNGINFDPHTGPTNHFALYATMKGVEWKGCVEARAEPYDTSDTTPHPGKKDTLWVPYLWPDEPDYGWGYSNNYLPDGVWGTSEYRQSHTHKYTGSRPSIDETAPNTRGPNKSCPQPLRPLTNNVEVLRADTNLMTSWGSSGTNIALGLAWGWRVLSPEAPFTEGVEYDDEEVEKALILLTDGENVVVSQNTHNKSDYNGYGYMSVGNLGTTSTWSAVQKVNAKVEKLCASIKAKGVRIYTITFQLNDNTLQDIFRACATTPNLYFDSPSNEELKLAFRTIAVDLSNLRLSK
ncbi:pilus assembly protein TadG-related protein [Tepidamorphus sp. 3E244]|uniref:pilus assembly protein TadG-related protein n=1 Tax=Tepidamorphus sp. 3E244 TaxID=3385498 RepID=UPI0038FC655E